MQQQHTIRGLNMSRLEKDEYNKLIASRRQEKEKQKRIARIKKLKFKAVVSLAVAVAVVLLTIFGLIVV